MNDLEITSPTSLEIGLATGPTVKLDDVTRQDETYDCMVTMLEKIPPSSEDGGDAAEEEKDKGREPEELTAVEAALHAEVDALGAPSEAGDDVGNIADAATAAKGAAADAPVAPLEPPEPPRRGRPLIPWSSRRLLSSYFHHHLSRPMSDRHV